MDSSYTRSIHGSKNTPHSYGHCPAPSATVPNRIIITDRLKPLDVRMAGCHRINFTVNNRKLTSHGVMTTFSMECGIAQQWRESRCGCLYHTKCLSNIHVYCVIYISSADCASFVVEIPVNKLLIGNKVFIEKCSFPQMSVNVWNNLSSNRINTRNYTNIKETSR